MFEKSIKNYRQRKRAGVLFSTNRRDMEGLKGIQMLCCSLGEQRRQSAQGLFRLWLRVRLRLRRWRRLGLIGLTSEGQM